jgi:dihydrofolate reductase
VTAVKGAASPSLILVAALDRNGAIGRGNQLPWHLPDDLKRFKARTLGHPVLMGRRTAESIGRALPGRTNLVLTRSAVAPYAGQVPVSSLHHALGQVGDQPLIVIGGAEVYALALPHADELWLTRVATEVDQADAFFPAIDAAAWREVSSEAHPTDDRHAHGFEFVDYARSTCD